LRITDAIVSVLSLEARITNFFFTRLNSSEECSECKVNPENHILQNLRMNGPEFGLGLFPDGQHLLRFKIAYRFSFLFKGVLSHSQSFVIDPSAKL